jgi:hypothetical protein
MKVRHVLIATAALAVGPAIAQDTAPQASGDCATLQAQVDQARRPQLPSSRDRLRCS